ncbi:MAG: hypothetical protein L3J39_12305 [Verrucomicrobiales bacterium]|nr:hypothetical protein [Verrucomicrobiales bacterium]
MKVSILQEAPNDLIQGYLFYEAQEPGVGEYFLDSLHADIDELPFYYGFHPLHLGFYRKLAKTFPYSIYYRLGKGEIFIDAIIDQRRNPDRVWSVLESRGKH